MTQVFHDTELAVLDVIKSMQDALKAASGEGAPPLPPLVRKPTATTENPSSSSKSFGQAAAAAATTTSIDTVVRRREKWEADTKEALTPHAANVQDACANLHGCLGNLSEFALDAEACEREKKMMVEETARLEEQIVQLYRKAANTEEILVKKLEATAMQQS